MLVSCPQIVIRLAKCILGRSFFAYLDESWLVASVCHVARGMAENPEADPFNSGCNILNKELYRELILLYTSILA